MSSAKSKKNKIVIICGPTASGKTSLALALAQVLQPASQISIDSRQAYQHLDILTGKDIPSGFQPHSSTKLKYLHQPAVYYQKDQIRLWGTNFISPEQSLNLSDFTRFAWQIIRQEASLSRQIILVGGTGLYLKAITTPLPNIHLPPNLKKRRILSHFPLAKLQAALKKTAPQRFKKLNQSDISNPRRLLRHLEIAQANQTIKEDYFPLQAESSFLWLGLKPAKEFAAQAIKKRVIGRLRTGAINEVKALLHCYPNQNLPIYSSLGVKQILAYLSKKLNKDQLILSWTQVELSYFNRQLTWFSKQPNIIWYDKDTANTKIINQVLKWLKKKPLPTKT